MIRFVTYYVKPSKEERERLLSAYRVTHRRDYNSSANVDETLSILHASVKKFHPEAEFTLLTDQTSRFTLPPSIKLVRYPRKSDELDREVLYALIYYLQQSKEQVDTIFLEWDQIVQADLTPLFARRADLYFAFRRIKPAPIDDAFIGIGRRNFGEVINFFNILLNEYYSMPAKPLRYWLGKSLILSFLFFDRMEQAAARGKTIAAFVIENTTISIVDGKEFSKKLQAGEESHYQAGAKVVHFSNQKSRFLKEYWEKFLEPV